MIENPYDLPMPKQIKNDDKVVTWLESTEQVLLHVTSVYKKNGYVPTYREISEYFRKENVEGLTSLCVIKRRIDDLVAAGYIHRMGRRWTLTEKGRALP